MNTPSKQIVNETAKIANHARRSRTARAENESPLHCSLQYANTIAGPFSLAEYWHRLSLDAPTIAFVWCCFFARAAHVQLPWFTPFLLALGTWIIYVADRLLDGLHSNGEKSLRERHRFYARHRLAFCLILSAAALVCGGLTLARMRHDVLTANALLAVLVCVYFALIHAAGRRVERWFPKELAVGCLFALATALPTMMRVPEWRPGVAAGLPGRWLAHPVR